jgi:hypothetical protein
MKKQKYIMVTPYYKETEHQLRRCIDSIRQQTVPCDHFLVADGFPQDWIDRESVRHLRLDVSHGDYGNTPRGIGAVIASSESYEGIGFVDADNWLEPDHVEACVEAASRCAGGVAECDYVRAARLFRRPDETLMPLAEDASSVDTNCFFFFAGSFAFLHHWAITPKAMSGIGDRIFCLMLERQSLTFQRTSKPTVNYHNLWASTYIAVGETPPEGAKPGFRPVDLQTWAKGHTRRGLEIANRLIGFAFFKLAT